MKTFLLDLAQLAWIKPILGFQTHFWNSSFVSMLAASLYPRMIHSVAFNCLPVQRLCQIYPICLIPKIYLHFWTAIDSFSPGLRVREVHLGHRAEPLWELRCPFRSRWTRGKSTSMHRGNSIGLPPPHRTTSRKRSRCSRTWGRGQNRPKD